MNPEVPMNPEDQQALEEARKYIGRVGNISPAKIGERCVDGRYTDSDDLGRIATPGGDFGYVLILLAVNNQLNLGLSAMQCADLIYTNILQTRQKFSIHTDSHAVSRLEEFDKPDEIMTGCGHIAKALTADSATAYGVSPQQVKEAYDLIRNKLNLNLVVLSGEHQEKGIIIVERVNNTVNPQDQQNMYFVWDRARDQDFRADIATLVWAFIEDRKTDLSFSQLQQAFNEVAGRQREQTLKQLALGKPIFRTNVDDPQSPQIQFAGKVS